MVRCGVLARVRAIAFDVKAAIAFEAALKLSMSVAR